MVDALSTDPGWEVQDSNGNWQPVEPGFDPTGLEPFEEGLWRFPDEALVKRPKRNVLVRLIFRRGVDALFEPREGGSSSVDWGERVLDDQVPGTEIYRDARGQYVFRHVGANHFYMEGTATYEDGSIGKRSTLTHPDGRVSHASGHTVYPDGRSLDRRTGMLTGVGGDHQQLERGADGGWDVPVSA